MKQNSKVLLIILDGWGIAKNKNLSAIDKARVPFFKSLLKSYPNSKLKASGKAVGLPEGQMGNSEVGHINIGAGRIVFQELEKIANAIDSGKIEKNPVFQELIRYCKDTGQPLHLMGLVSDGGVHSSINHLYGLLNRLKKHELNKIYLHCFTDGRDTDPFSGLTYIKELNQYLKDLGIGKIASIIGRYYAMDRDKRWERTKIAYDMLIHGKGRVFSDPVKAVKDAYTRGESDEFITPMCISEDFPITIQEGDALFNFNFRTDRNRQISEVFTQCSLSEYGMFTLPNLYYVTMNRYDESYKNIEVLFEREPIINSLGKVIAEHGLAQTRIAETEKYPHVTFFFNGGHEEPYNGENRILCPSPKVATYDLKPEMSAKEVTDVLMNEIQNSDSDFICVNYANPDMVGHTGVLTAAIKACETVDLCLSKIVPLALENNYKMIITSDHGNADQLLNEDGTPNTAHTLAEVPCLFVDKEKSNVQLSDGILGDLAPTILYLLQIEQPAEMTGKNLIVPIPEKVIT